MTVEKVSRRAHAGEAIRFDGSRDSGAQILEAMDERGIVASLFEQPRGEDGDPLWVRVGGMFVRPGWWVVLRNGFLEDVLDDEDFADEWQVDEQ